MRCIEVWLGDQRLRQGVAVKLFSVENNLPLVLATDSLVAAKS